MDGPVRRARIADVAKAAGVSKATVSIAFNNAERLNPDTAQRVFEVAAALGYRPHPVARMLAQRRTRMLGVLSPHALAVAFANPYFSMFAQGVAAVAEELGYGLVFVPPIQGSLALAAGRATVDGFVAAGLGVDHPEVEEIRQARLPIVLVDSALPEHGSVEVDNEAGAFEAAEHLLALGHTAFLVLAVEPPTFAPRDESGPLIQGGVMAERLRGYRLALAGAGLSLDEARTVAGPATFGGGMAAFESARERGLEFTAVLSMSDVMAIGALHAARTHGLRVPGDVSIVGFDDVDVATYVDPPLTTVHQPAREKGELAVRLLTASLDGSDPPEHRRLGTRLIVRASSGPRAGIPEEVSATL